MLDFPEPTRVPYWTSHEIAYALQQLRKVDSLMTQGQQLSDQMTTLQGHVDNLASEIASEINDLAAAVAASGHPNPLVTEVIDRMRATNAQLTSLKDSLAADNQPVPQPEPAPEPTP